MDADVVFVVGLAEDLLPGRVPDDALLPDRILALTAGQLAPVRDRLDRQHRQLLAALAAKASIMVLMSLAFSYTSMPAGWLAIPCNWSLRSQRRRARGLR